VVRPTPIPELNRVNIQWLARLRWAEVAGQAATVLAAHFLLGGRLPIAPLLAVIGIGLLSNLVVEMYFFGDRRRGLAPEEQRPVHEWQLALIMMIDIAILTGLLYLTGGPHNPFSFLYLVQIALAAVIVRARWTWMLVGLSFVGFGILILAHMPLAIPDDSRVIGAWVALGVASAFVVHFLFRITTALAERERELTEARGLTARQERLAALATMAAGAAHELSTPLGTVALAAKELERALTGDHQADARLIREQVGRCRAILEQMAQGAGTVGENLASCTVSELLDEACVGIREAPHVVRELGDDVGGSTLRVPPRAVSQALRSLVTNAQDASPPTSAVVVTVRRDRGRVGDARSDNPSTSGVRPRIAEEVLTIVIRDRGGGIPEAVLAKIGEPFFTTKAPGRGMGLGLFLARAVIEGVGGTLEIEPGEGGTAVYVRLPTDVAGERQIVASSPVRESTAPRIVSKPA
jgi:two-component system, sensor histidine kinase RegB